MQYRRARTEGGTYFFTVVTYKRKAMLTHPENVYLLREAFSQVGWVEVRNPTFADSMKQLTRSVKRNEL